MFLTRTSDVTMAYGTWFCSNFPVTEMTPRRRWEDNNRMDLRETGWDGVDWIHLAQDRDQWRVLVNTAMNFRVP
jgi:hypothetical protein